MAARADGAAPPGSRFRPPTPVVIGLVGGIAAGKSTVAGLFEASGLRLVDADAIAREVSDEAEVVRAVAADLGPEFVVDGRLDRQALAAQVFRDPGRRQRLEAIVHPRVRKRIRELLAEARAAGDSALLDVPLLFEGGLYELCDTIAFVAASDAVRAERARIRGWADGELARREQNQLPLAEKRARCQHVVDNDGDLTATRAAVAELLQRLETVS